MSRSILTSLGQRLVLRMRVTRTWTHIHWPWRLDRLDCSINPNPGERGGQLLPKLLRPGALKSEEQRQALRSQAGEGIIHPKA